MTINADGRPLGMRAISRLLSRVRVRLDEARSKQRSRFRYGRAHGQHVRPGVDDRRVQRRGHEFAVVESQVRPARALVTTYGFAYGAVEISGAVHVFSNREVGGLRPVGFGRSLAFSAPLQEAPNQGDGCGKYVSTAAVGSHWAIRAWPRPPVSGATPC